MALFVKNLNFGLTLFLMFLAHLILDVLGSVSVFKSVQSLHEVPVSGTDACNHHGLRVTAQ